MRGCRWELHPTNRACICGLLSARASRLRMYVAEVLAPKGVAYKPMATYNNGVRVTVFLESSDFLNSISEKVCTNLARILFRLTVCARHVQNLSGISPISLFSPFCVQVCAQRTPNRRYGV